jgi:hypothetical protein
MTSIDWNAVGREAITAAITSLGASWDKVRPTTQPSIQLLVQTGQYIVDNYANLSEIERRLLEEGQRLAIKNVLLAYEDIGILAAEQAVAAVWAVIEKAIKTALGGWPTKVAA